MRTTTFIGITQLGEEYQSELTNLHDTEQWVTGMFGEDIIRIQEGIDKHGNVVESFVQEEPWSSGPMIFMAWRYKDTEEPVEITLWSQEEINQYL